MGGVRRGGCGEEGGEVWEMGGREERDRRGIVREIVTARERRGTRNRPTDRQTDTDTDTRTHPQTQTHGHTGTHTQKNRQRASPKLWPRADGREGAGAGGVGSRKA
eukprot:1216489-Rhodomonas_salina.2